MSCSGGALGLAVQDSVNQYCMNNSLPVRRLRFMEVSYLSPCKGKVLITVTPLVHLQSEDKGINGHHNQSYYPVTGGVTDSFRVVIRAAEKPSKNGKVKTGPSKIYVQALVILF